MNIKKIIDFCNTFNIDLDDLEFYPGYKREIFMCIPEEDFVRIYPQETDNEDVLEEFHEKWWSVCTEFDPPAFNVYY